jgi:hypothetical protein
MSADAYTELATAILVWDLMYYEGGTREQQIKADHTLHELALRLREIGYDIRWKDSDDTP